MRRTIILCLLVIFGLSCIVSASNLDAPAEKKVTVRSEIERGSRSVINAGSKISALNNDRLIDEFDRIINENVQRNTDTNAFYLGVYFQAWSEMLIRLEFVSNERDKQRYRSQAESYFQGFRSKQKQLAINDDEFLDLFNFNKTYISKLENQVIPEWEKNK